MGQPGESGEVCGGGRGRVSDRDREEEEAGVW